jgi:hypothetical protein
MGTALKSTAEAQRFAEVTQRKTKTLNVFALLCVTSASLRLCGEVFSILSTSIAP